MKIKKFNNLWTMGLILIITILLVLNIAKWFFPEFVIEVAQTPQIVKFGQYVDTHKWAWYLFSIFNSFILSWFYCCACLRKKYLNIKDIVVTLIFIGLTYVFLEYLPQQYVGLSLIIQIIHPMVLAIISKNQDYKVLYSTGICFAVNNICQLFSLEIRGLINLITQYNIATFTMLSIDGYIWIILLYFLFNFKYKESNNG